MLTKEEMEYLLRFKPKVRYKKLQKMIEDKLEAEVGRHIEQWTDLRKLNMRNLGNG